MEIFKTIGRLMPESFIDRVDRLIKQSGVSIDGDKFLGIVIFLTLAYIMAIVILYFTKPVNSFFANFAVDIIKVDKTQSSFVGFIAYLLFCFFLYFLIATIVYGYFVFKADIRKNAVESVLPEFFSLVSSNIRGGMPLEQALWQAAKPEFGILSIEVKSTVKEVFAGTPVDKALDSLEKRFNSALLSRTINILKEALRSGGEIAVILDKTAEEARDIVISRKEIRASLLVSTIFLVFASVIGVPALLAVTNMLILTLEKTFTFSSGQQIGFGGMNVNISKPVFSSKEFYWFSLISIFINIFIASFIVSVAYTGTKRQAFRYFPIMLIVSYIIFYIATLLVSNFMVNIGG